MMPLRNLLYLLQLEEYDLGRFREWLKNNPGRTVLENKKKIDWTAKAKIIFGLGWIFNILTLGRQSDIAIISAARFFSPFDYLVKKIIIFLAKLKISAKDGEKLTVIGVTGSYGKTTTKNILYHLLAPKFKTLKTEGNYNTLLGVAKTILKYLKPEHRIFICEMGAYQRGDIESISRLVKPRIGIITAIDPMHFERFGSMENILEAKLELIESLPPDGLGFLPIELKSKLANRNFLSQVIFFSSREEIFEKIGNYFNLDKGEVLGNLKTAPPTSHRQEIIRASGNITIIDDTYNSNPVGFSSALEVLENTGAKRKILVTPGMIELGEKQFELNKEAARSAAQVADFIIIVGETNKKPLEEGLRKELGNDYIKKVYKVPDLNMAKSKLSELMTPDSAVLLENDLPDHYF